MRKIKWSKIGFAALVLTCLLASTALVFAAEAGHGAAHGGGISHEKLMDLLWRTLNFIGLVIILVWTLKKPIVNGLAGRRQAIQDQFEELEARKAEAEQVYREYEAKLAKIDQEAGKIIEAAVKQGEAEKARIIAEAERAAGDIKRQAEMAVQYELANAKYQLRSEVADQAVLLAEELIKKNLQPADQEKMVADYLGKVGGIQ